MVNTQILMIDGLDLFSEVKVLREILKDKVNTPMEILNYIKELESLPNACITYRILLTILVTINNMNLTLDINVTRCKWLSLGRMVPWP